MEGSNRLKWVKQQDSKHLAKSKKITLIILNYCSEELDPWKFIDAAF